LKNVVTDNPWRRRVGALPSIRESSTQAARSSAECCCAPSSDARPARMNPDAPFSGARGQDSPAFCGG
jgi:hypothetical protein